MRLKINKLFGERDYYITFNKDLTILIGENGAGKSTITKILNSIFDGDLISLSQIDFESITLTVPMTDNYKIIDIINGKPYPREKVEVTILKEDIKQLEYAYDARFKVILKNFLNQYDYQKDIDSIKIDFERFLKEFDDYFQKEKSNIKVIPPLEVDKDEDMKIYFDKKEYEDFDHMSSKGYFSQKDNYNIIYNETLQELNILYGSKDYLKMMYLIFYKIELFRRFKINEKEKIVRPFVGEIDGINKKEYMELSGKGNMIVSILRSKSSLNNNIDYSLFKDFYDASIYIKKEECFIIDKYDFEFKDEDRKRMLLIWEFPYYNLVCLQELFTSKVDDYVQFLDTNNYKSTLMTEEKLVELIQFLSNPINENAIIGNVSTVYFKDNYDENRLKKYECILKLINQSYSLYPKIKEKFSTIDYDKYIDLAKHQNEKEYIISEYLKDLKKSNYTGEDWILELSKDIDKAFVFETGKRGISSDALFKPHLFDLDKLFEKMDKLNLQDYHDSNEAKAFYELTARYFKSKNFLLAYDENGEIIVKIYDKKSNKELTEENLSSGEYKMLRLIKKLSFEQKYEGILILDEPELSLSIYWQKMLIDDILKYLKNSITIVATQSPSLVSEDHIKYLKEVQHDE